MSFSVPSFPLTCDLFTAGNFGVPARTSSRCNLAWGRRVNVASTGGTSTIGVPLVCMSLLLPAGTDVRGPVSAGGEDGCECPAGSGRRYSVVAVDDIGKGFANEHRCAVLLATGVWPTPIP